MPLRWTTITTPDFWTLYHAVEEINGVPYEWSCRLPDDPLPNDEIPGYVKILGEIAFARTKEMLNES